MISKNNVLKFIARNKQQKRNVPIYHFVENPFPNTYYNNFMKKNNYVLRKYNQHRGMVTVRNPTGFSQNLKLTNVNHYELSKNNQRYLRALRRQNVKNTNEFHKTQALKLSKKMVQQLFYKNGLPNVWINSNGREINAPSTTNIENYKSPRHMLAEGYQNLLKHLKNSINIYHRTHPNLKLKYHYRQIKVRK
jgi:hypothetical protein